MKKNFDSDNFADNLIAILISALFVFITYVVDAWIGMWLCNDIIGLPWLNGGEMTFWPMFGIIWLGHLIFPSRDND
jgi:hypothetical protein